MKYPHLMAPLTVGRVSLRNRVVMGAMHTRLDMLDRPAARLAAFFRERARGEVGLILTGGISPNAEGRMEEGAPVLDDEQHIAGHREICDGVHREGGKIALQLLHAGRYAKHPLCVGPGDERAPINRFTPRALSTSEVWRTIADYVRSAELARASGYDGIEIMGSEGYLINQFTAERTNRRTDAFGGSFEARIRLPLEILRAVRLATGTDFLLIYRISAIDLVEGGMTGPETAEFARQAVAAGADALNTGIGWHESSIPTIAASVPRAAWMFAIANVHAAVDVPVIASNRINTPEAAEAVIADGHADLVSMARPLLADPEFARKTRLGETDEINTCIACNQACLDRIFTDRTASCLVNPQAARELELLPERSAVSKNIAVIGAGPAGMAFSIHAARRGHRIVLYEASSRLGGQLNSARMIPGKSEFDEMLRYFYKALLKHGVELRLSMLVSPADLRGYDKVVLATGSTPLLPDLKGIDHPKVLAYKEVLEQSKPVGKRVAIIGAGGIGFDVAEFLLGDKKESLSPCLFLDSWGVDVSMSASGGVLAARPPSAPPEHQVFLLQRRAESFGKRLGKSTGWILKSSLQRSGVSMIGNVHYEAIDDQGLHYTVEGKPCHLAVDTIVICAGQVSERRMLGPLREAGIEVHLIGGADTAAELDAARAIEQAYRLALAL